MNVIWIVIDTLRRDAVGAYGNAKMHTPAMDTLAKKSVQFNKHYIGSFPTMPTRADHMTGRWTVSFMSWEPLPKNLVTLPGILAGDGMHTAAIVDTPFYLRGGMNYDRGFITFEEIPGQLWTARGSDPRQRGGIWQRKPALETDCCAPQTFAKAMQWLELNYKDNFFLYIDTWDPHEPWNAPDYYTEIYWPGYDGELIRPLYGYWKDSPEYPEKRVKKAHATYCGEVSMVDTWVGYLMKKVENMGLMDNTVIILTSDHGYYFGEHGLFGKMVFAKDTDPGQTVNENIGIWSRSPYYEEVTKIPLLVYIPGIPPGTYSGMTSAIDMMPTILDILGKEIPSDVEGRSLLPMMKDSSIHGYDHVFCSSSYVNVGDSDNSVDGVTRLAEKASMATVTTEEWTLLYDIESGGSELYNIKSDPGQKKNVINKHADVARELHKLYVRHMRETNVPKVKLEPRLELKL
jgi:arylsulfatase A-like enzyme